LPRPRAGFASYRRRAQAALDATVSARQIAERSLAAQERLYGRVATLARQGLAAPLRVDQLEIDVLAHRRALTEARAAETLARRQLEDAVAGRFVSDGRTSQAAPAQVAEEISALLAQRNGINEMLDGLRRRIPLHAPCDCRLIQLGTSSGAFVAAGDAIAALSEVGQSEASEVDALVPAARFGLLRLGQPVKVYLGGAGDAVPGRIVNLSLSHEAGGRVGLPARLRQVDRHGLVTVRLDSVPAGAAIGLPALLKAPVELGMLLRSLVVLP
jgi:multidrug efflux pump subunit AcrA (membrane-fusion protein)